MNPSADKTLREQPDSEPAIREPTGAETTLVETAGSGETAQALLLGPGVEIDGWLLREAIKVTSGEADLWVATGKDSQTAVVKVFRWGLRPKAEIEAKLWKVSRAQVVEVYGRGVLPDGRHYEILEHIRHGTLADLGKGGLPPARVKEVLKELADAVEALHEAGILHRDLKPSNVLVRTVEPLDLVLTDFGISSLAELSLHATSAHRTAAYSAPEAMTGVVSRASDWWSIGVMVLELLRASHPFAGLDERAVNFQLVTRGIEVPPDLAPDWALLVKGLLTRDHAKRWGAEQVRAWLEGRRNLTVHYTAAAAAVIGQKPYRFQGQEYGDAAGLAVALAEQWEEGIKHWGRGYVLQWVEKDLSDQDLASQLHDVQDDKGLPTGGLQLAAAVLVMSPELPLNYKGQLVTCDWLGSNWETGRQVLDSRLPHWLRRLRDESWLEEALERWKTGIRFIERSGVELNGDAAERLLVAGNRAVVYELVAERRGKYVKGRQENLTQLLKKESLDFNEAVLLASATDKVFYTAEQLREEEEAQRLREGREFLGRSGVTVNSEKADGLLTSGDRAAVDKLVAERRQKYVEGRQGIVTLLLKKTALDFNEAVLLASANAKEFYTPEQLRVEEGNSFLRQHKVALDTDMAERLLRSGERDAVDKLVAERRSKYVQGRKEILTRLLKKEPLDFNEGVLLASAVDKGFYTAEQLRVEQLRAEEAQRLRKRSESLRLVVEDGLTWLDKQYVTYDRQLAKDLLAANNWDVLMPLVEERRVKCLRGKGNRRFIDGLLQKPELEYGEAVLLVTASPELFETYEDEDRRKENARRERTAKLAAWLKVCAVCCACLAALAGILALNNWAEWADANTSGADPTPFRPARAICCVFFLLSSGLFFVLSARMRLAETYTSGQGVKKDHAEAAKWQREGDKTVVRINTPSPRPQPGARE